MKENEDFVFQQIKENKELHAMILGLQETFNIKFTDTRDKLAEYESQKKGEKALIELI